MKKEELLKIDNIDGKVLAFPTDTVYGVGAKITDKEGINKIYELKERDYDKPLAVLVGTLEDAISLVDGLPKEAVDLIIKHWPGALTIICDKSSIVPSFLNPKFQTIGIRMPNNKTALEILKKYGPMATTSINISGEEPLNNYNDIVNQFGCQIDYIIESNEESSNISSTVIEIKDGNINVIRQGNIIVR